MASKLGRKVCGIPNGQFMTRDIFYYPIYWCHLEHFQFSIQKSCSKLTKTLVAVQILLPYEPVHHKQLISSLKTYD